MTDNGKIREAVELATKRWSPVAVGGDTNLVDVEWIGTNIRTTMLVELPIALPRKSVGVDAFECLERTVLADAQRRVLRDIPAADVVDRVINVIEPLRTILPFSDVQNLVVTLYTWHGCMHMGKLLRCTYVVPGGEALYSPQMRRDHYAHLQQEWTRYQVQGNPWIRYGVSVARLMEQRRKGADFDFEVHENWISRDSPYWEP